MANPLLLKSSIILGFINLVFVEFFDVPNYFRTYMWLGVFTSIWNHGTTSKIAKFSDRFVIIANAIPEFFYIMQIDPEYWFWKAACVLLFFSGIFSFIIAKIKIATKNNENIHGNKQHFLCHFLITVEHLLLSYYFHAISA